MKLRNKKTGEIGINEGEDIEDKRFCIRSEKTGRIYVYDSLAGLNEEWEDYKPAEPLIKNEKVRGIVQAWSNENMVKRLTAYYKLGEGTTLESCGAKITFYGDFGLRNGAAYTIAELCGEDDV